MRLQKWTRGVFAIINTGGHITYWSPLFKSEGPAQVAIIVLTFLINVLSVSVPFEEWNEIGLNSLKIYVLTHFGSIVV